MTRKTAQSYFEEILEIPRPSGKEELIAGYLVHFAMKNKLEYHVDKYSNVIIKKKGTLPYKCEPVILQAHIDMVCASESNYDFNNKGIDWYIEDGYYKARGTTLGADNGVGVAIIMSILADQSLSHPPIEAVFTAQEETTMAGAKFLDYKKLKGKSLIGLDSTDDNKITVSCAGMASITVESKIEPIKSIWSSYQLTVSGLLGGHSGVDINKGRGNAIKILADILDLVDDIEIVAIEGGIKENVIPSSARCIFKSQNDFSHRIAQIKDEYKEAYKGIKISLKKITKNHESMSTKDSKQIISFINELENGVLKKNEIGFPLTSCNFGVIETEDDKIVMKISIRSSIVGFEDYYVSKTETLAKKKKLKYILEDKKPFFTMKDESNLRQLLVDSYKKLFNENVTLEDVHAGLEGGVFAGSIKDLDVVCIGANLIDYHSINERAEIESIKKVRKWLIETLTNME